MCFYLFQNPNPGKLYDGHSLFLDKLTKQKFEVNHATASFLTTL